VRTNVLGVLKLIQTWSAVWIYRPFLGSQQGSSTCWTGPLNRIRNATIDTYRLFHLDRCLLNFLASSATCIASSLVRHQNNDLGCFSFEVRIA
jgi:hypothetical protein